MTHSEWKQVKLGDIAVITMGNSPPGETYNTSGHGTPLINGPVEFSEGPLGSTIKSKWTTAPTKHCRQGDLLVCVRGSTTGRTNVATFDACIGRGVAAIRALEHQPYINRFLCTLRQRIFTSGKGSTFPSISQEQLAGLQIPLPPLPEQKRIAAILDAADDLRAKRRESIEQLDSLIQVTFLEMFGDPVTNPKGWASVPLNEIGEYVSGSTPSKQCDEYWSGSTPWVSPKDMKVPYIRDSEDHVTEQAFRDTGLKQIEPFHLLMVVRGMILAHSFPVALNVVSVAINQDMKAIRLRPTLVPHYVLVCLQQKKKELLAKVSTAGHGTKRFDAQAIQSILMPLPPFDAQTRFASIVESIEHQKARLQAHLAELDTLFASLQSRAFNGELVA